MDRTPVIHAARCLSFGCSVNCRCVLLVVGLNSYATLAGTSARDFKTFAGSQNGNTQIQPPYCKKSSHSGWPKDLMGEKRGRWASSKRAVGGGGLGCDDLSASFQIASTAHGGTSSGFGESGGASGGAVRCHCPRNGGRPELLQPISREWVSLRRWFHNYAHFAVQQKTPPEQELQSQFAALETYILTSMRTFYEGMEGLDEILGEANS